MGLLAYAVATLIMTMMILFGNRMGFMPSGYNMITDGLGGMMNKIMNAIPKEMGWVVHLGIGLWAHPFFHGLVWDFMPGWFGAVVYSLVFGLIMVMMIPQLNVPEGTDKNKMIIGVLMAHIVYGLIFPLNF